jgi:hypothetical protein
MYILTKIAREASLDVPFINAGGCAIFALNMAKELAPLRPEIYNISSLIPKFAKQYSKQKTLLATSCDHVVIKVAGVYLDSNGVAHNKDAVRKPWYGRTFTKVSLKETQEAVQHKSNWNPKFDRDEYKSVLEEQIKLAVSKNLCPLLKDKFITKK